MLQVCTRTHADFSHMHTQISEQNRVANVHGQFTITDTDTYQQAMTLEYPHGTMQYRQSDKCLWHPKGKTEPNFTSNIFFNVLSFSRPKRSSNIGIHASVGNTVPAGAAQGGTNYFSPRITPPPFGPASAITTPRTSPNPAVPVASREAVFNVSATSPQPSSAHGTSGSRSVNKAIVPMAGANGQYASTDDEVVNDEEDEEDDQADESEDNDEKEDNEGSDDSKVEQSEGGVADKSTEDEGEGDAHEEDDQEKEENTSEVENNAGQEEQQELPHCKKVAIDQEKESAPRSSREATPSQDQPKDKGTDSRIITSNIAAIPKYHTVKAEPAQGTNSTTKDSGSVNKENSTTSSELTKNVQQTSEKQAVPSSKPTAALQRKPTPLDITYSSSQTVDGEKQEISVSPTSTSSMPGAAAPSAWAHQLRKNSHSQLTSTGEGSPTNRSRCA